MPNAAASLDSDFGFQAPARRKPARPARRKKGSGKSQRGRSALLDSMPRYGAIAISVLIGVGIVVNALMMQHGHHPAPLFAGPASEKAAAKVAAAKPAAKIEVVAPAPRDVEAAPVVEAPSRPATHPAPARTVHGDDPIAKLIGGAPSAAPAHKRKPQSEKAAAGKATASKTASGKTAQDKHRGKEE